MPQAFGYLISTKMSVLELVGQVIEASKSGQEMELQDHVERFINDEQFQRRMIETVFENIQNPEHSG